MRVGEQVFERKSDILKSLLHSNNTTCNENHTDNHNLNNIIENNRLVVNMKNSIGRKKHDFTFNYQFRNLDELLCSQSYDDLPRMVQRDICNPKQDGVLTNRRTSEINLLRHEVLVFVINSVLDMCDDTSSDDSSDEETE